MRPSQVETRLRQTIVVVLFIAMWMVFADCESCYFPFVESLPFFCCISFIADLCSF